MYAVLVWHVIKEDKNNSQIIDIQMRPPGTLAREVMCIITKSYIHGYLTVIHTTLRPNTMPWRFQILQNREQRVITAEPTRKYAIILAHGLAHAITMTIISATHQILVRNSNFSNSVQVNLRNVL